MTDKTLLLPRPKEGKNTKKSQFFSASLREGQCVGKGVIIQYNPQLKKYAQDLRKNSTKAELFLWAALKNKQLGLRFNRQKMINNFIVDFYNKDLKLAIEIDDPSHDQRYESDQKRTLILESFGIQILRFTNKEVFTNREGVVMVIKEFINKYKPTHNPSNGGE